MFVSLSCDYGINLMLCCLAYVIMFENVHERCLCADMENSINLRDYIPTALRDKFDELARELEDNVVVYNALGVEWRVTPENSAQIISMFMAEHVGLTADIPVSAQTRFLKPSEVADIFAKIRKEVLPPKNNLYEWKFTPG